MRSAAGSFDTARSALTWDSALTLESALNLENLEVRGAAREHDTPAEICFKIPHGACLGVAPVRRRFTIDQVLSQLRICSHR